MIEAIQDQIVFNLQKYLYVLIDLGVIIIMANMFVSSASREIIFAIIKKQGVK